MRPITPPTLHAAILVPTCGRERELMRCLDALQLEIKRADRQVELITIHAPGDEASREAVSKRGDDVRILESPRRNLSFQRNLGARETDAPIVIYFDDDAWPQAGWLRAMLAPFEDPTLDAVGGLVFHPDGQVQFGRMCTTRFARPITIAQDAAMPRHCMPLLPGGNLAVRRSALFSLGGFDENLAYHFDDLEFSLRLAEAGHRVAYSSRAAIFHESASGPHRRTYYDRDWFTVAKNGVYVGLKHGEQNPVAWCVPALLQIPKSLRLFAWGFSGRLHPWRAVRAIGSHALGIAAGYLKAVLRRQRLPLHPIAERGTEVRTPISSAAPTPQRSKAQSQKQIG